MNPETFPLVCVLVAGLALNANAETRYVDVNCLSPTPPYTNWLTAATNIQNAVDAARDGDLVLVTNGVYQFGGMPDGKVPDRLALTKPVTVRGANGPTGTKPSIS